MDVDYQFGGIDLNLPLEDEEAFAGFHANFQTISAVGEDDVGRGHVEVH